MASSSELFIIYNTILKFNCRAHKYMMVHIGVTILIIILLIVVLISKYGPGLRKWKRVGPGARKWNVVGDYENSEDAARLLERTNRTIIGFLRGLKHKYHIDETDDIAAVHSGDRFSDHNRMVNAGADLYNIIDHLLDNYNPDVFFENDPRCTSDTSYTLDKGRAMYICLRNKDKPDTLVDESTLLFTMLHEISHIANYRGWGHGNDFWACFKFILHEAQLAGIYHPIDYTRYPTNFCGLVINWNPLLDDSVPKLWE